MKEWDMVKFILFASLFLCLAGGALYFFQKSDLGNMEKDLPRCTRKLTDIGQLSAEVDLRMAELARDDAVLYADGFALRGSTYRELCELGIGDVHGNARLLIASWVPHWRGSFPSASTPSPAWNHGRPPTLHWAFLIRIDMKGAGRVLGSTTHG